MFSTLPSTPSLNASTGMSSSSWRAWSATHSESIASTLATPSVSCTVIAVITDSGWQPMLASVSRSACSPAPPDGSEPAKVSTMGGVSARSFGMDEPRARGVKGNRRVGLLQFAILVHRTAPLVLDEKVHVPDLRLDLRRGG